MSLLRRGGLFTAAVLLAGGLFGGPVLAQNALCPTSISSQPGIGFQGSSCTNNVTGAYSNTALASQSLGELSQSSTQDATKATMASVSDRRTAETQRCPDGFTRVNGVCKPGTSASRFAPEAPDSGTLMSIPDSLLAFQPVLKPRRPAPPPTVEPPRWAVWTQAYGDYERLKGGSPGVGEFSVLGLKATSSTWSGGVLGGGDVTFRNLVGSGDGLIVGVLGGYESSHMSVSTSSLSSDPTSPSGFSTLKAQLSGPTTGVYASYFNGGFSTDLAFKVEFFDVGISFNDLLGFQSNPDVGFPPTSVPFSGSGSTSLNNYTTSGNVNYRIPVATNLWVEPTAGFQYTRSDYASGADQLGLANGSDTRLQGGTRLGVDGMWNAVRVTTVFTGLLYDHVAVSGGVLQNSPNPQILSDEGKLNAEGIAALNFYHGNGVISFVQADVLGGPRLFGAGGKAGVRVAW